MFVDVSECLELQSDDCLSSPAIILNVWSLPAQNVSISKNLRSLNAPRFICKVSFSAVNIAARLFVAHHEAHCVCPECTPNNAVKTSVK